jgi:hypothetical protein
MRNAFTSYRRSVADTYFHVELSKMIGVQASNEWLRSSVAHDTRPISTPASSSSSSQMSSWSEQSTSVHERATKDSLSSTFIGKCEFQAQDMSRENKYRAGSSKSCKDLDIFLSEPEASSTQDINFGLLFTDAAHTILDNNHDIASLMRRWNSTVF